MDAISAKLSSNNQVCVPKKVRDLLRLEPGDRLVYVITDDGMVILQKSYAQDLQYLEASLVEWGMEEDEQAFGEL